MSSVISYMTREITNPKLQISNKSQIPNVNTKYQTKFFYLVIVYYFPDTTLAVGWGLSVWILFVPFDY